MQRIQTLGGLLGMILLAATIGCAERADQGEVDVETTPVAAGGNPKTGDEGEGHNLEGWWCTAHGVPEDVCGLCDVKLAAKMQREGDWCGEHDRPDSQCFACHPELEARFAAQYEAKTGKKPPKPAS